MAPEDPQQGDRIQEGDTVLITDGRDRRFLLTASPDMDKVNGLGVVDGSRLMDSSFGDAFELGRFRGYLLRPTQRDLAEGLRGRAQTILPKDSAIIIMYCGIRAGSRVLEVGAGSGAMTVALCEAVGPGGQVLSLERREDFARVVEGNVRGFGLGDRWHAVICDAAEGVDGTGYGAAVVDVPEPWTVVGPVRGALAGGAVMALFVPTTNQLERAVGAMAGEGLVELESMEVLVRPMEVGEGGVRPAHHMLAHTAYLAFGRKVNR